MVIENVTENWDIKRDVHAQLDEVLDPTAVVIVNTSAIPTPAWLQWVAIQSG